MIQTPDFPAWRHRWAALKRKVQELRSYSLSQLEHLFEGTVPVPLLSQSDEGLNSRERVFSIRVTFWGFLLLTLQRLLGHSRLSTTTTYLHVRQERVDYVSSALDLIDFGRARPSA